MQHCFNRGWGVGLALLAAGILLLGGPAGAGRAAPTFADPHFQQTWERADKPVADGQATRSWLWGPQPRYALVEPYKEATGGARLVQYFDKARMELANPQAGAADPAAVTSGLLVVEMISGRVQVGNNAYEPRCIPNTPAVGDADDGRGPTYATLGRLAASPRAERRGGQATATTDRAGTVGDDPAKATLPATRLVYYDGTTGRNIPQVFWDFLHTQGPVYQNGRYQNAPLLAAWALTSGLPISEAYWTWAKIGGSDREVLVQAFERRVLTYIPAYAGTPFAVQMGNVGLHYYDWRYGGAGCPAPPSGSSGAPNDPGAPNGSGDPNADACTGIPAAQHATITPNCGKLGTTFVVSVRGLPADADVRYWITRPDGQVVGGSRPANGHSNRGGSSYDLVFDSNVLTGLAANPRGVWSLTYEGGQADYQPIVWFKIVSGNNPAPPACDTTGSRDAAVNPPSGPVGTTFGVTVSGFQPGELASAWLTSPTGSVLAVPAQIAIPTGGRLTLPITTRDFGPGRWAYTVQGLSSGQQAIAFFCLTP